MGCDVKCVIFAGTDTTTHRHNDTQTQNASPEIWACIDLKLKNMKLRTIILTLLMAWGVMGCSKVEMPEAEPEVTLLRVKAEFKDKKKAPNGNVYIWDATENEMASEQHLLDGLAFGKAKAKDGGEVRAIGSGVLLTDGTASGAISSHSSVLFNLDEAMFYNTERKSGKLLVAIILSGTEKFTYKFVDWRREQNAEITKVFDGDRPLYSFEAW